MKKICNDEQVMNDVNYAVNFLYRATNQDNRDLIDSLDKLEEAKEINNRTSKKGAGNNDNI